MSLIEKLDAHFRGGVMPPWWLAFADDPAGAVEDLLLGRAALGHLSRAEPAELLLDWLEGLDAGIVAAVDDALAGWIAKSWGVPVLERAADSAALTATAWSRACDVVGSERRLEQAHAALLARVPEDLAFLPSLSAGRSRDPQGRAWLALARRQTDRELIDLWWRLCRLPVEVAWYHGALGVRGLRGLPEEHPGAGGGFPWEAAEGLVRWARALEQRCREGWLEQQKAENEFLRTARLTMWAYNWHDRWTGFWKQHLPFELDLDGMADGWIRQVMPEKLRGASRDARQKRHVQPNRDWSQDAMALAHQLRSPAPATVLEAQSLLDEQQSYAEATGDTEFVVRTACNFASRIRSREPAKALEWLRLARRFEPDDAHVWTTEAIVLRDLNDFDAALRTATEAVRRFPYDPVSHTTLAEILRAQGRRREAEWVYGAAAERFPEHAESHAGWAEVVKEQGRLEEAERLYRDAYRRFPDDAAAANGLAGVLCARGRLDEAEEFYQGVLRRDRGDGHARRGLRMVEDARRRAARASSVAETPVPYDASPLFAPLRSDDVEMLLQDAFFLRRWALAHIDERFDAEQIRARARQLFESLGAKAGTDPRAASEGGLMGLAAGDLEAVHELLRQATKRFPGSIRVTHALIRAESEIARRDAEPPPSALWTSLVRLDNRFEPLRFFGEGREMLRRDDRAAADLLGKLGWRIHDALERAVDSERDPKAAEPFVVAWFKEAGELIFDGKVPRGARELGDLAALRARVVERDAALSGHEEIFVGHLGRV